MKIIVRIIKNAGKWKWQLFFATFALLAVTGINLAAPAMVRQLFSVLEKQPDDAQTQIIIIGVVLLGLYLLRIVFQFLNNYLAHTAAWGSVAKMRGNLYNHLQTLSMRFYKNKQTGQLMSRVVEDTANFEVLIAHALPDLISSILIFAGVLTIVFFINWQLALLTCIPLPLILFCTFFMRKMRRHFTERQVISAELNATLQDNFSGIKEIQLFNRQDQEHQKVGDKAQSHADKTMKGIFWVSVLHPATNFLTGLGTLIVIVFGGLFVLNGTNALLATDITVFLLYLGLLYAPVTTFARVLEDIQTATVSGKRVFEILDTKSDVENLPGAKEYPRLLGEVEFKNVSFSYDPDLATLKNVSFKAGAGKMIALVGATGAGKSTIAYLLARFYDPCDGSIAIGGVDIRDMTLASLRDQISMVLQDVFLFNGTLADNIAYGAQNASMEQIIEAAKTAQIHDFIDALPDKYNTVAGERGLRLSGGQKQRIAIARAILRGAPVIILDEATSAVDNRTEADIQQSISKFAGKSTLIVIAHRLSTIEKADEILFLEDGKIVERGTHAELMAAGGKYSLMQSSLT